MFPRVLRLRKFSDFHVCGQATYKSSISLDKVYPTSSLDINKTQEPPQNEPTKFGGYIPPDKLRITHCRSSGPGGQHVNTTNSKVDIRFKISDADWLPQQIRNTLQIKCRSHINKEGYFVVLSDRTRSQHLNTADALEKMRELIRSCEPVEPAEPSEEVLEKIRKSQEKSARERLRVKRDRQVVRRHRGGSTVADLST